MSIMHVTFSAPRFSRVMFRIKFTLFFTSRAVKNLNYPGVRRGEKSENVGNKEITLISILLRKIREIFPPRLNKKPARKNLSQKR